MTSAAASAINAPGTAREENGLRAAVLLAALLALPALPSSAQEGPVSAESRATGRRRVEKASLLLPDTELIDVPTAGVLDQGGFYTRTRFFSQGGVVEWLNFGVFPRVNLGASFNVDRLLGTGSPVQLTRPELQLKLRFFDGDQVIPAFALGYDGQGYLYNRPIKRYNQRHRGLYVVGSQEIGLPGLQGHAGMNVSDFDTNDLYGFMALSLNISDKVLIMTEWDNINNYRDSRVNMGLRTYVTPAFLIDFAVRGVGQGGDYSNGVSRGPERVAMFKYTGNF